MSKCMTLADETIEQKDTCKEIDAKDIVEFILEEALISAVIFSDKGCNRIGDFNITEDFCQQFDEIPANSKNFEVDKIKSERDSGNKDVNFNSGETVDRVASLVTAKENLEFILDSLPKKDENRLKNTNDCTIITEETLADNELRIENGQIHIERNKSHNVRLNSPDRVRLSDFYEKEDVIKDERIEIEYFEDGKLKKIYVPWSEAPLTKSNNLLTSVCQQGSDEEHIVSQETPRNDNDNTEEAAQRPFAPYSTEELRQVWDNANSSIVGGWDGDMSTQPEEVARIIEELSSVQVFPNSPADPNRPRTCEFGEESVKKMTKEIEEINFNQSHNSLSEDLDPACHPDGQGDADLETKSFIIKSQNDIEKSSTAQKDREECSLSEESKYKLPIYQSRDDLESSLWIDRKNEEVVLSSQVYASQSKTEGTVNEEKEKEFELTRKSIETLVKSPSIKFNAEEYLTESVSPSDRSVLINQSENGKNVPPRSSSDKLNASLESEKEIDHGNEKIDKERSLDNSEEIVQCTLDGGSLEEKADDATAKTLNSKEEVGEKKNGIDGVKSDSTSLSSYTENPSLDLISAHLQESDVSLRKSRKASDLSLKGRKLFDEINGSKNVLDATEKNVKSVEGLSDCGNNANPLSQSSKSVTGKTLQDLAEKRLESGNEKIFEEALEMDDSFTGEREIQMTYSEAHPLARMNREISDLEIVTTKSENYSPSTDLSRDRLIEEFEDVGNRNNIQTVPNPYQIEKSRILKDSKIEEQQEDRNETEDINLNSKELQKEDLISQKEEEEEAEDEFPNNTCTLKSATNNDSSFKTAHQAFKLHSQKMYLGSDLEPTNFEGNKYVLTDSEEAFIDSTEDVIQVIDPHENCNDEDSGTISFSLLNETSADEERRPPLITDIVDTSNIFIPSNNELSQDENILRRNVFSGMTTIGPMKNLDVDPKDLTAPEIDFGKMTRISSSRQLAKDIFSTEINSTSSAKTYEEHDSDGESSMMMMEGERLDIGSLINRDIASLTKVQKVKEVMSYHPRADEDFEDDDTLTRPRLDLKDVESMTDERYKIPDVSIPLLSFEMGNSNSETDKEYLQGMHLVLSGNCFSNNAYYEDDLDENNVQTHRNRSLAETDLSDVKKTHDVETSDFVPIEKKRGKSQNSIDDVNEKENSSSLNAEHLLAMNDTNREHASNSSTSHQKYGTLSSVFKKASSKIIRKESDLFLRNSKSLPRDTSRITATDSIRSILEDCHSSATNVLKKSRSFLKSTQSIFKTMSQNRFGVQSSSTNLSRQRMTASDTDTNAESNTLDRKPSAFQWKEDLSKAKTLIKNKVGKTFKSLERTSSRENDSGTSSEHKDLRLAVRNEENYRVDRAENFRKLLPKSPLIYNSEIVQSQMSVQSDVRDHVSPTCSASSTCTELDSQQRDVKKDSKMLLDEESGEKTLEEDSGNLKNEDISERKNSEKESTPFNEDETCKNDLTWTVEQAGEGEHIQEEEQPEYIVMETIQGLPTVDLENYSYETDHQKDKTSAKTVSFEKTQENTDGSERNQAEVSNYSQHTPTSCSPFESDVEEEKNVATTPSEQKVRAKNKKFTARFRSFWSSAFGKVKTSPKNKDPS